MPDTVAAARAASALAAGDSWNPARTSPDRGKHAAQERRKVGHVTRVRR